MPGGNESVLVETVRSMCHRVKIQFTGRAVAPELVQGPRGEDPEKGWVRSDGQAGTGGVQETANGTTTPKCENPTRRKKRQVD
ncbi:hypothetical protein RUM43_009205 [Polyplax serrata]|uniref:Uncharacterized protein n=1 Tax=Polyplax serrata TaxID=468196 RepID=A0AAN8PAG2_POLSC